MKMLFSSGKALCFLTFVLCIVSECRGEGYRPAPNCATHQCPEYSVIHSQPEFEIRSYKEAQWVSAPQISSNSYKEAARKSFKRLSDYFKGNNSANVVIKMTTPVLVDVRNSVYTTYFFVPKEYQTNIPAPLSKEIEAVKLPTHKYAAVKRFNGFMTDDVIPTQIAALKKSLEGTPYQSAVALGLSTMAAYNAPFRTVDRVNEVFLWFD